MTFSVQSEVGQLRQAIVHRPGLELSRLTPQNIGDLLFDDVLWAQRAKEEHDVFAEILRGPGRAGALLRAVAGRKRWTCPRAGRSCWTGCAPPRSWARRWSARSANCSTDLDGSRLAEYLIGGVLKADLRPRHARSLKWDMLAADDFLLPPLPNHLFTRDNSAWVYGGVSMNPMAKPARQREHLHIRAVYSYHPMFAGADFVT